MKFFQAVSLVVAVATLAGCGANVMRPAPDTALASPDAGHAKIVFMRSSMVAAAIGCDLFEVENGKLKFIGALGNGDKIVYETTPGEKTLMAYGTAADFMKANVVGGKTYYSIVRPNWGTGGFAPTPIRSDGTTEYNMKSAEFSAWTKNTKLIEKNDKADAWFKEKESQFNEVYEMYWKRWMTKTDAEKVERTLRPEDGV